MLNHLLLMCSKGKLLVSETNAKSCADVCFAPMLGHYETCKIKFRNIGKLMTLPTLINGLGYSLYILNNKDALAFVITAFENTLPLKGIRLTNKMLAIGHVGDYQQSGIQYFPLEGKMMSSLALLKLGSY